MSQGKLGMPRLGLSLQFVTAEALNVDWQNVAGECADGYEIVLPRPTYADIRERAPDLLTEWEEAETDEEETPARVSFNPDEEITDEHAREFEGTDAWFEWRDGFEPMMNYAWPVSLAYGGPSAEDAARLINQFGGACSLISFQEERNPFGEDSDAPEYAIALTGGGMDLSDHIAAAYLCCGCVPPERILSGLSGVMNARRAAALPLAEAYERAADWFRARADRLDSERERLQLRESAE